MHRRTQETKVICCFPGVLKSDFMDASENFYGWNILDAVTADYSQNAFDLYKTELSGTQLLISLIKAIEADYLSGKYDIIFVPIMQSFVGKLEQRVPITIITLNQKDKEKFLNTKIPYQNRDLIKLYQECEFVQKTLSNHPNVTILELPEGERRIPNPETWNQ